MSTHDGSPSSAERFETARLALFEAHGFVAEGRRIPHGTRGDTYALVRDEGGVPIVLVHGGLSESSGWYALAGKLAGTVVVPDRPGCGLSYAIDYRGVDYRHEAADWLSSVVDGLGVEHVDLVGSSMGGFFSMAFALAHPERVRRLVLAGAPAGLDRHIPMFLRLLGKPLIGRVLWNMQPTDAETLRKRVFGTLMAHPERVAPAALEVGRVNASFASSKRCVRTMLRNVCDWNGWRPELAMREAMTSLPTPTLFAWGDKDSFAPASSGQELAARMPNARVEVIKDTGHLPQCDSPDALAKLIAAFGLAVVLCIFSIGCVGDNATTIDAGSPDASIRQDASTDAASVNCVYGTGEFGNCKFGP